MRLTEGASHLWATIRSRKISVTFSDEATGRQKWLTRITLPFFNVCHTRHSLVPGLGSDAFHWWKVV